MRLTPVAACVLTFGLFGPGNALAQREPVGPALYKLEDAYLRWPLPKGDEAYGRIDGKHLKTYVSELTAISRRSRDRGDQYWGRIAGTQSDKETQQWLLAKFKAIGLEDVRLQEFDMPPHWSPKSWEVSVSSEGKTIKLGTARPLQWAAATPPGGLTLNAVWVGLGTPADFLGRDVKGKAVFIHSTPTPGMRNHTAMWNGAMKRAEDLGAATVVVVFGMPGNVASQLISGAGVTKVPVFSIGLGDGTAVRELIEKGRTPSVRFSLDVEMATGRKTANVWGVLPGTTDEDVVVIAHTDAHFDGALDNASGVATMLGLAEYFVSVPKAQRRRTIKFVGLPAHHTGQGAPREQAEPVGSQGARWMHDNRATFFARTAMVINAEHTSQTQMYLSGSEMVKSNTVSARRWFVSGSDDFKKLVVSVFDRHGVATYENPENRPGGELSQVYRDAPGVHVIDHIFYHTDMDTEEFIPPTGLESVTRAYAKLIDEVNRLELKTLRAPAEPSDR
jgi:hypothetical protein